ncbi:MAG: hypothetical protein JWQ76_4525 [Ramlibacter sp.]|nr:hypothetical protein [Ramlibacter sp.]
MHARLTLATLAVALLASPSLARAQASLDERVTSQRFTIEHVLIASRRSFDEVRAALEAKLQHYDERIAAMLRQGEAERARVELERLAAPTGLTILQTLNHGSALVLRGGRRNAIQYGIGNVLIATEMTQHRLAAGLYAPIRVLLYEAEGSTAVFEYDRPSTAFALFGDDRIDAVAKRLDAQLQSVLQDVSR